MNQAAKNTRQKAKDTKQEMDFLELIENDINRNLLKTGFDIALSGDTFYETRIISRDSQAEE
jgi:hypothetical protein